MLVSALVVTWNSAEHVTACIDALLAQRGADVEVVVVDNASQDTTRELLAAYGDAITVLAQDTNLGYAAGNDTAAAVAAGDLLWLVNPDCVPDPGCARALADHLAGSPGCGVAAALLRYPDGSPQEFCRREPTVCEALWAFCELPRRLDLRRGGREARRRRYADLDLVAAPVTVVDCPAAACVLVRRADVGAPVFRTDLPLLFNDAELYRRLRGRGLRCEVVAAATAAHAYGASVRAVPDARRRAETVASLVRYQRDAWPAAARATLVAALVADAVGCLARRSTRASGRGTLGGLGLPGGAAPWLAPPAFGSGRRRSERG